MKILFIAPDIRLDGELKGDSIHTIELANAFMANGVDLRFCASGKPPDWCDVPVKDFLDFSNCGTKVIPQVNAISKWLGSWKPDAIYERRYHPKLGITLSERLGAPTFNEINGDVRAEMSEGGTISVMKKTISDMRIKHYYNKVSGIVTVTKGLETVISNRYNIPKVKMTTIGNGVNLEMFRPLEKYDFHSTPMKMVFVGFLAPWQGLDILLKALPGIEGVTLSIVGSGKDEDKIRCMVSALDLGKVVKMEGHVSYREIPSILHKHHVGIAPFSSVRNKAVGIDVAKASLAGSPLKLYEYMACGLPVITTDMAPLPAIVGDAGITCKPDDVESLSKAIERMKGMDKKKMSLTAIELSKTRSWKLTAKRIMDFIEVRS